MNRCRFLQSFALAFAATLFVLPARAQDPAPAAEPAPPADAAASAPADDEAAVRQVIAAFNTAFDKADPEAMGRLFTEDGQVVGPDGTPAKGRDAIARQYAEFFKQHPGASITVETESIRFLSPDVAQEEGTSIVHPADGGPPFKDRYSVIYVKRDGQWLQHEVRDYPIPGDTAQAAEEAVEYEDPMSQLDWLVGDWVDESPEVTISHHCRYILNGRYIIREYSAQRELEPSVDGFHIIGYDAQSGLFKSWGFDGEGSRGEAIWAREGDRWVIKMTGVLGDGRSVSATQILDRVNKDALRISAVERTIDGELASDRAEITLVRKPPAPPEDLGVDQPAPETTSSESPTPVPAPTPAP